MAAQFSVFGVLVSAVSYGLIGAGQFLQKYSFDKVQVVNKKSSSSSHRSIWLFGIVLCYICDIIGNSYALSLISPAIMAPLSVISVIVNVVLAHFFLEERVSRKAQMGYLLVLFGVLSILFVSPSPSPSKSDPNLDPASKSSWFSSAKHSPSAMDSIANVISTPGSYSALIAIFCGQVFLIWILVVRGTRRFALHVIGSAVCGSSSLLCAKLLSIAVKASVTAGNFSPLELLLDFRGILLICYLVANMIFNEIIRQISMAKFPISQYQTNLFSVYNIFVVFESILVLGETVYLVLFVPFFSLGITLMYTGSSIIQRETGSFIIGLGAEGSPLSPAKSE